MIKNACTTMLRCRLENVIAVAVSLGLLALFCGTRLVREFNFGLWDLLFILLPVGILGLKTLFSMLVSSADRDAQQETVGQFLAGFFKPFLKIARDWFPFFLLTACYYSLFTNFILRINPHSADDALAAIDASVLGSQAAFLLEPCIHPWITNVLEVVYFSFVLYLPGIALYFYLKKEHVAFRRLMMGYLTLMLMGITSYILVPAVGPEIHFADQFTKGLQGQPLTKGMGYIMKSARVGHDCFPSLHVGIPLLLSFYIRDYRKKAFLPALCYVSLMCAATIYLRAHYVVDVFASFLFAPAAYRLNDFLLARWPGERIVSAIPAEVPTQAGV